MGADWGNHLYVAVTAGYLAFVRACCKYGVIHKMSKILSQEKEDKAC